MSTEINKIEWFDFVSSFLDIVEIGCKETIDPKHVEGARLGLHVAIVYNMKHAIEIFVKALIKIIDNHSGENTKTHDLNFLFDKLIKRMSSGDIKKKVDESDGLAEFAKQEIDDFSKKLEEIGEIINYYNKLEFLEKDNIEIIDVDNTLFKYPEYSQNAGVKINYFDFIYGNLGFLYKILEDVSKLRGLLGSIKAVFYTIH